MEKAIVIYDNKVELYVPFRYKNRLESIKWGRRFDWRKKCWVFEPNKHEDTNGVAEIVQKKFPDFHVMQGIKDAGKDIKRIVSVDRENIYFQCGPDDDESFRQLIASSKWDKKKERYSCSLSMDNLRIIKNNFEGTELSDDDTTRFEYSKFVERYKAYNALTETLNKVKSGDIVTDYDFPMKPFDHQIPMTTFLLKARKSALVADCGTGKTFCVINEIAARIKNGEIDRALIICPLSVMYNAWAGDIDKFKTNNSYSVLWIPTSGKKRKDYVISELEQNKDIYIINFDGVRIYKDLLFDKGFKMVVVDESSKIKNEKSAVFKAIKEVSKFSEVRHILSATPAPNGVEDAWSQYYFMDDGDTLGSDFKDFKSRYFFLKPAMTKNNEYSHPILMLKPNSTERLHEEIEKRSFRIRSEDCQDLPEKLPMKRSIQMTKKQLKHYNEMEEALFTELENGTVIEASNDMVVLGKLRQITSGFVMNPEDDEPVNWLMDPDKNPKIQACDDIVEQVVGSGKKVIIWCQYRTEIKTLFDRYVEMGHSCVHYYGATSAKDKVGNIDKFIKDPECKIMIAHPKSLGHGVTLVVANYAIYFSVDYDQDSYYQSTKRIHRPGQKEKCFYYHLLCPETIDMAIIRKIAKKTNQQSYLIDGKFNRKLFEKLKEDKNEAK